MHRLIPRLLWIDSIAGLSVGAFVLVFSPWLRALYQMSGTLLLTLGAANLCYGLYSFSLARRPQRPMALIAALAIANAGWALVCVALLLSKGAQFSLLGRGTLAFEAVFVGLLAALEWAHRAELA